MDLYKRLIITLIMQYLAVIFRKSRQTALAFIRYICLLIQISNQTIMWHNSVHKNMFLKPNIRTAKKHGVVADNYNMNM